MELTSRVVRAPEGTSIDARYNAERGCTEACIKVGGMDHLQVEVELNDAVPNYKQLFTDANYSHVWHSTFVLLRIARMMYQSVHEMNPDGFLQEFMALIAFMRFYEATCLKPEERFVMEMELSDEEVESFADTVKQMQKMTEEAARKAGMV